MKNSIYLVIGILLVSAQAFGQVNTNPIKHYLIEGNQSKVEMLSEISEQIIFTSEDRPKDAAFVPPFIASTVLELIFKYGPKLFYDPNKYIKEYGVSHPLFQDEGQKFLESFTYKKTGVDKDRKPVSISELNFQVKEIDYLSNYKVLTLSNVKIKRTPVKLKNTSKTVNLVAEITLHYYDVNHSKKEFKLSPITIKNIVPGGPTNLSASTNASQVIPPINNVEKIELKLTEVNSRKKDWDAWLEFYEDREDQIKELFSGLIAKQ